jgi:hypothetical protein
MGRNWNPAVSAGCRTIRKIVSIVSGAGAVTLLTLEGAAKRAIFPA